MLCPRPSMATLVYGGVDCPEQDLAGPLWGGGDWDCIVREVLRVGDGRVRLETAALQISSSKSAALEMMRSLSRGSTVVGRCSSGRWSYQPICAMSRISRNIGSSARSVSEIVRTER